MENKNFDNGNYLFNYFNSCPDAVFLLNPDYTIININIAAARDTKTFNGTTAQIGSNLLDFIETPQKEIFKYNFNKALIGEEIRLKSLRDTTAQNCWEVVVFLPLMDAGGAIIGVIYQKAIVKEAKEKEDNINESEYRLKLVLEGANVGWWDWNLETGMNYFDAKWWAMIGYTPNEIPMTNNFRNTIYYPEDLDKVFHSFEKALEAGTTNYEIEYRLIHKDGHIVPVLSRGYILRNHLGIPIRISGTNMDLTEQKKREALHQQSENYLKTIFQNTEVGYIFIDENLLILSFNEPAQTISTSISNQPIAIGYNLLDCVKEVRKAKIQDKFNTVSEGQKIEYDIKVLIKNEEANWYHIKFSPVLNSENKVANIIVSLENITERKKNELQLNKSFDLVSAQNKRLLSFSYIVSHNLRSHTSNILSIVDFLHDAETETERMEMIDHIISVSRLLDETLSNLNDILSIHTNINLIFEPLILSVFISKAITGLKNQIDEKEATIINNISKNLVLNYNPAYLESILLNFLSNAIRYSHPDRLPIITLNASQDKGKLILTIADNGIGIDLQKNGEKLFGLYKTFNGNPDARGIGLFITKSQIEFMGGLVKVESELGKGTTFKIYF